MNINNAIYTCFKHYPSLFLRADYGFEESVEFLRELEQLTGFEFVKPERKAQHIAESIMMLNHPVSFDVEGLDEFHNKLGHHNLKNLDPECKASLIELLNYVLNHDIHLKYSIKEQYIFEDEDQRQDLFSSYLSKSKEILSSLLAQ